MSVKRFEEVSELYTATAAAVSAEPGKWMEFLDAACYNYGLRFDEQLLVYAQKPGARAVLQTVRWNREFHRWVNKGSDSIAVFAEPGGSGGRLNHYFDISDTHEGYNARPVPQWEMQPEYAGAILEALEDGSGRIRNRDTLGQALKEAAELAADGDTVFEALSAIDSRRAGTPLESMSDEEVYMLCRRLVSGSTGYMLIRRCGLEPGRYYAPEDFAGLRAFSSVQTLDVLGAAVNATAKPLLRTIARTVKIQSAERRRDNGREQESAEVQSESQDRHRLRADRGLLLSEVQAAGGEGASVGDLRTAASGVAEGSQSGPVRGVAGAGRDERVSVRSGAESGRNDGTPDEAASGAAGRDGGAEGQRSDGLGWSDEQHPEPGTGDRESGSDLHGLTPDPTEAEQKENIASEAEQEGSAFVISQEDIDSVLASGSGFENGKYRIWRQFQKHEDSKANIAFLRKEYGIGGRTHIFPDGARGHSWHNGKGIGINRGGNYTKPDLWLSWPKAEKRLGQLMAAGRYLNRAEKERYLQWIRQPENGGQEKADLPAENREYLPGDVVYIGVDEYEILKIDETFVTLIDRQFPLLSKELTRKDFEEKARENPLNSERRPQQPRYLVISYDHIENGTDEKLDYPTLEEAEKAARGYINGSLEEDGFAYEGAAVYDKQEERYVLTLGHFPVPDEARETEPLEEKPDIPAEEPRIETAAEYPAVGNKLPRPDERRNFRIDEEDTGAGTRSQRYRNNIAAIRLLGELEKEGRMATEEEQQILARYVGWGGLADCFDERHSKYGELKSLLTEEEYTAARESTLTAFYTPPAVIRGVYRALENLGFQTGNILEPSCGIGNFMGLIPESMETAKVYGVELDSISGRIAQQLYQRNKIAVQGFENTELPDSFFDAAVGNVPFGQFKVSDRRYDRYNFLIHDYFFAKTLDKVRPGGIIAFITSKGTLDKENPSVRKYIAQRAELLGAIRLPNNIFKNAAGTEVTSDIIFLQKRDTLIAAEPDWVHLGKDGNSLTINQYFIDHPEMVLGEMREISGPYGPETACIPFKSQALSEILNEAVGRLQGQITEYERDEAEEETIDAVPADPSVRNFSYTLVDGNLYFRENSRMLPKKVSAAQTNRIKGMIELRDCVRQLIECQVEDYPESRIAAEQERLNLLYDGFCEKYGRLNDRTNRLAFADDSSCYLLSSLEVLDDDGNFVRKADIFSKRTIRQKNVILSVETASEALTLSLAEKAKVDMDYMRQLTGKSEEDICRDLKGVIFLNPAYRYEESTAEKYLPADEYLSGNVREKLAQARRAAETNPADYAVNVEALEKAQPEDLSAAEISVRLGAIWIPETVIEEFMYELLNTPWWSQRKIHVHFSSYTGEWNVEGKAVDQQNVKAQSTYGTERINAYKIIEDTLNLRDVRVFDYVLDSESRRIPVLNKRETVIAQSKQELIKQAFQDWVWAEPERREQLVKLYNERFNSIRPREYDGSHLNFAGINTEIKLRPHQVNAVARILYGGNTLLAHVVGAGKTFEMVAAAQESKRLGLCQKSLFVVPNHLTEQWGTEYLRLYPAANILVATKKDFESKNRKRFCTRIATGDYDAVIIGHSQFEKIPLSIEQQRSMLEQQVDEIVSGIAELKKSRGDSFSIKQLERSKKTVKQKLDRLNDQARKDDVITFEELGIDRLFVDEAHYYKNLAAFSKMRNVSGISQAEAQKSSDLLMKCRYMDNLTGGKGIIFATGTPISNSMVELYTMQKYLQHEALREKGLLNFDAWASTFGECVTAIELAPEGTGYRTKTRFARFYNLPELMKIFREVADIQTADMLNLPVPKANKHNIALKPSELQKEMVKGLADRAEKIRSKAVASSEDNMLIITNDGRKLALDQRLINPLLPDSGTSKASACAENVFAVWQQTAAQRSTQLIFCDLSTPHGDSSFNVYDDIREKLIGKGIPAEEIAYIHSAKTEAQKKELFGKVRSGQIRILLGSTPKMGAGTDIQDKLKALHHLDCPWRPSDLQQQEGRIIRQGNENAEVDIFTYVTENTFDSYLYQLVENKQKIIGQVMTGKSPVRSAEDIDAAALSYAEIKALTTSNPYIKEKMELDIEVQKLRTLKSSYLSMKYALEDKIIREFPQELARIREELAGLKQDQETAKAHPRETGDSFRMVLCDSTYRKKEAAGNMLIKACQTLKMDETLPLGSYRGFALALCWEPFTKGFQVIIRGKTAQAATLSNDPRGNISRIDNAIDHIDERLTRAKDLLAGTEKQLEAAKEEAQKPFAKESELREKSARLEELNALLSLDRPENEAIDEDIGCTPAEPERKYLECTR